MAPKLSIITINFNNEEGLNRTLESVINQSYTEFEYIVIDGGSSDESPNLIKKYSDKISFWVSEPDSGIYNAMNKGIARANGEYLLFLNSGDVLLNCKTLEENIEFVRDFDLVYFNTFLKDEEKEFVKTYSADLSIDYLINDTIPHQGTFIKRSLFDTVGLYDETLRIVSDWKFFLLALIRYNCTYKKIEKTLSVFYLGGISSKAENKYLNDYERKKVLETEFPMIKYLHEKHQKINKYYSALSHQIKDYKLSRKYKIFRYFNLIKKLP
jgi:glycosyltransferase involved in cell wall biosynthesis